MSPFFTPFSFSLRVSAIALSTAMKRDSTTTRDIGGYTSSIRSEASNKIYIEEWRHKIQHSLFVKLLNQSSTKNKTTINAQSKSWIVGVSDQTHFRPRTYPNRSWISLACRMLPWCSIRKATRREADTIKTFTNSNFYATSDFEIYYLMDFKVKGKYRVLRRSRSQIQGGYSLMILFVDSPNSRCDNRTRAGFRSDGEGRAHRTRCIVSVEAQSLDSVGYVWVRSE
ncbi:hypothetical protein F4781DRAFT_258907 [Annulohypoxylon bovei var. microspora]|nr:hypothetical protein F4781DRAFT_258907 [Annulohypoxylon bovei var. microspora]